MATIIKRGTTTYKRVGEATILDDTATYAVLAKYKGEMFGELPFPKITGTYDECAAYAERNESPDNPERYFVAEVIED